MRHDGLSPKMGSRLSIAFPLMGRRKPRAPPHTASSARESSSRSSPGLLHPMASNSADQVSSSRRASDSSSTASSERVLNFCIRTVPGQPKQHLVTTSEACLYENSMFLTRYRTQAQAWAQPEAAGGGASTSPSAAIPSNHAHHALV